MNRYDKNGNNCERRARMTRGRGRRATGLKSAVCAGFAAALLMLTVYGSIPRTHAGADPAKPSGAELFQANCARCHGTDAKGGKGPDLTSEKRQAKWKDGSEKLVAKITNGGFIMPAFKKKLSAAEIGEIAEYVRTLK